MSHLCNDKQLKTKTETKALDTDSLLLQREEIQPSQQGQRQH